MQRVYQHSKRLRFCDDPWQICHISSLFWQFPFVKPDIWKRTLGVAVLLPGLAGAVSMRYSVSYVWPSGYSSVGIFSGSPSKQVGWGYPNGTNVPHALMWSSAGGYSCVDLNPGPNMRSVAAGASHSLKALPRALQVLSDCQVGQAGPLGSPYHAYLWKNQASNGTDLHPAGFTESGASDACGLLQVGWARKASSEQHAMLWFGSAASATDLHPSGWLSSVCNRTGSIVQVGSGTNPWDGYTHPLMWRGSASSAVDLLPSFFQNAEVCGTNDTYEVGGGWGANWYDPPQALMWSGSSASCKVLHPAGYFASEALSVNGRNQVGWAQASGASMTHAVIWSGTADSMADLHQWLKPSFTSSDAQWIDSTTGAIYGDATDGQGRSWGIIWTPIYDAGNPSLP